jgi:hypothetical protein
MGRNPCQAFYAEEQEPGHRAEAEAQGPSQGQRLQRSGDGVEVRLHHKCISALVQ